MLPPCGATLVPSCTPHNSTVSGSVSFVMYFEGAETGVTRSDYLQPAHVTIRYAPQLNLLLSCFRLACVCSRDGPGFPL